MSTNKNANFDFIAKSLIDHQDSLYRLAYTYVRNESLAMDIVQETACKALKSANQLRNRSYVKTWLCRIVINESKTHFRKVKHLVLVDDSTKYIDEVAQVNDDNDDLFEALNQLDEERKSIVMLRYFEDLPFKDISEILGININTVKSKLYRSLEMMKIIMKDGDLDER